MPVNGGAKAIFPLTVRWDLGKYPENVTTGVLSEPDGAMRKAAEGTPGGRKKHFRLGESS